MNTRLDSIDYFKGLSIIMIIICHAAQVYELPAFAEAFTSFGRMGCQIFFLLSGYTITMSYDKYTPDLLTFYKKRLLGIAPGYWLALLFTILLSVITILFTGKNQLGTSLKIDGIVANLLLIHGFIPTEANNLIFRGGWFIGTLTILYFLYPFLYKGERKFGNYFLWVCIFVSMLLSSIGFIYTNNASYPCGGFLYFSFVNQLPPFILGFLLYRDTENRCTDLLSSIFFLSLSVLLFYPQIFLRAVFVPFLFSLAFFYLYRFMREKRIVYNNLVVNMGKMSYSIFLLHIFFVWDVPKLILHLFLPLNWVTFTIWGIMSIAIIYVVGKLFNNLINLFTQKIYKFFPRKVS